jgi:hypothetical protein
MNQNQTYRHEVQGGYLWSPILVDRVKCVCDTQVGAALGIRRASDAAGFFGYCRRILRVQGHLHALAGCESARLECHPSIRLPENDRIAEND